MSDKKKVTEKANKEKVIGGADSYNPAQKDKDKSIITSPIEIKGNKYVIKPLSMLDVKKLNIEKRKLKKGDEDEEYDFGFSTLLYVIKKFNDNAKGLTIEDLQEMIDVDDFERVQAEIIELAGMKKFFLSGGIKK
ncbi:hypothetical protein ES708_33341 [subsurface metagenome]